LTWSEGNTRQVGARSGTGKSDGNLRKARLGSRDSWRSRVMAEVEQRVGLGQIGMTKTGSVGKAGRGMFLKSTAQVGV
jgi:hypothetical protein